MRNYAIFMLLLLVNCTNTNNGIGDGASVSSGTDTSTTTSTATDTSTITTTSTSTSTSTNTITSTTTDTSTSTTTSTTTDTSTSMTTNTSTNTTTSTNPSPSAGSKTASTTTKNPSPSKTPPCQVQLTTSRPDEITANYNIVASWSSTCPTSNQDHLNLYFGTVATAAQNSWWSASTAGQAQGTINFPAPQASGTFTLAFFRNLDTLPVAVKSINVLKPSTTPVCLTQGTARSNIEHVVIIIQENHSFDSFFGNYCKAPTGSAPTCTKGPRCCEAGPKTVQGYQPFVLNDTQNMAFDPSHILECETLEINNGKMDQFITGAFCSDPRNFAYADATTMSPYWNLASSYALADHFFQSAVGASAENNMYLARASFVFPNNDFQPNAIGNRCKPSKTAVTLTDPNLGSLLNACTVPWSFYAEGYAQSVQNPTVCGSYNPLNNPFEYYQGLVDNPLYQKDYGQLATDVTNGTLPAVSFVKALGWHDEHPMRSTLSAGQLFVSATISTILNSPLYQENTLILVYQDESGGYYDHVPPPPVSKVDGKAYGTRVPLLAIGYFAKTNTISHVQMEPSSIVRFIEWNFLGGEPGQLGNRDLIVRGIGSLLDPKKTGVIVP